MRQPDLAALDSPPEAQRAPRPVLLLPAGQQPEIASVNRVQGPALLDIQPHPAADPFHRQIIVQGRDRPILHPVDLIADKFDPLPGNLTSLRLDGLGEQLVASAVLRHVSRSAGQG